MVMLMGHLLRFARDKIKRPDFKGCGGLTGYMV